MDRNGVGGHIVSGGIACIKHAGSQILAVFTARFLFRIYYLRQGYVIVVVCLFVLCLSATLRKNVRMDLHEIFREGW